jgi:hypothetical protein
MIRNHHVQVAGGLAFFISIDANGLTYFFNEEKSAQAALAQQQFSGLRLKTVKKPYAGRDTLFYTLTLTKEQFGLHDHHALLGINQLRQQCQIDEIISRLKNSTPKLINDACLLAGEDGDSILLLAMTVIAKETRSITTRITELIQLTNPDTFHHAITLQNSSALCAWERLMYLEFADLFSQILDTRTSAMIDKDIVLKNAKGINHLFSFASQCLSEDNFIKFISKSTQNGIDAALLSVDDWGCSGFANATFASTNGFMKLIDISSPEALNKALMIKVKKEFGAQTSFRGAIEMLEPVVLRKLFEKASKANRRYIDCVLMESDTLGNSGFLLAVLFLRLSPDILIQLFSQASCAALSSVLSQVDANGNSGFVSAIHYLKESPAVLIQLFKKMNRHTIDTLLMQNSKEVNGFFAALEDLDLETFKELVKMASPLVIAKLKTRQPSGFTRNGKHNLALYNHNFESKNEAFSEKNIETLLDELEQNNEANPAVLKPLPNGKSIEYILEVADRVYLRDSSITRRGKPITQWECEDIQCWAAKIKALDKFSKPTEAHDSRYLPEIIAVLIRASVLDSQHKPRKTQLISVLLLLNSVKDKGRLLEVETGGGKSTIIAMLAVIKALQGNNVDIITSSPVLAARDTSEKSYFYSLFNLTVADNWDERDGDYYRGGEKPCYKANIVYGDGYHYQWDLLREEYYQYPTRGNRTYDIAIIDEVDAMLLGFNYTGEIAERFSGMGSFQLLLTAIWRQLLEIDRSFNEDKKMIVADRRGETEAILKKYIYALITQHNTPVSLPDHLKEFALSQLNCWAENAIRALYDYKEQSQYVITQDEDGVNSIVPLMSDTGVTLKNNVWEDGLHQFLEIEHRLKVRPENIAACFISNLSYFKRYGHQLYGLTGTLGAEAEQKLLQHAYPVDLVFVPSYKSKKLIQVQSILASTTEYWLLRVAERAKQEADNKRSVLIICDSINAVNQIEAKLKTLPGLVENQIKRYSRSDTDEAVIITQTIQAGDIIVATNLAGRGADPKLDAMVEENGGMHVIVAFLPHSLSVEKQAFGRTARQGKSGTAHLIVNREEAVWQLSAYPGLGTADSIESIKAWRDKAEIVRLAEIKSKEVPIIELRDKLFDQFKLFKNGLSGVNFNRHKIKDIEFRWALWLKIKVREMTKDLILDEKKYLVAFDHFQNEMQALFERDLSDPYGLILNGNDLLDGKYFENIPEQGLRLIPGVADPDAAIANYTKAIEQLQSDFAVHAFYNRAIAKAQLGHYGECAKDLEITKTLIKRYCISNPTDQKELLAQSPDTTTQQHDFATQKDNMVAFYEKQIQSIDITLDEIQKAISYGYEIESHKKAIGEPIFFGMATVNVPKLELMDLQDAGFSGLLALQAIEDDDDISVFDVVAGVFLGGIQMMAGVGFLSAGYGILGRAAIGMGVGGMLGVARGCVEGKFNFYDHLKQEKINAVIAILSMGVDVIKQGMIAAEATKVSQLTAAESVKEVSAVVRKEAMMGEATRQLKKSLVISAVKEVSSAVLVKQVTNLFKNQIARVIRKSLYENLNRDEIKQALNKLFAADELNGNNEYAKQLHYDTINLLRGKNSFKSAATSILHGVASHFDAGLGALLKSADMGKELVRLTEFSDHFCDEFSHIIMTKSHSLPYTTQDCSAQRASLYQYLADTLIRYVKQGLHHSVISLASSMATSYVVGRTVAKLERIRQEEEQIKFFENEIKREQQKSSETKTELKKDADFDVIEQSNLLTLFSMGNNIVGTTNSELLSIALSATNTSTDIISGIDTDEIDPILDATRRADPYIILAHVNEERVREVENFHISEYSDVTDGNVIGLVVYDYQDKRKFALNGREIQEGYIYFRTPESIKNEPGNTQHAKLYHSLFGTAWNEYSNDMTISGFARQNGEWRRASTTFNSNFGKYYSNNTMPDSRYMSDYEFNAVTNTTKKYMKRGLLAQDVMQIMSDKVNQWHIVDRSLGLLQCVGGIAQVSASVAGGALTVETGIGPVLAASFATIGMDNVITGFKQAWTGERQSTLLNRGLQDLGLNANQAAIVEIGTNLAPIGSSHLVRGAASSVKNFSFFNTKKSIVSGEANFLAHARQIGEGDYLRTGVSSPQLASTFIGWRYKTYMLTEDFILYRAGPLRTSRPGYFSFDKPVGELQVRFDKAIKPVWPGGGASVVNTGYAVKIPKGTVVHVGEVSTQGGLFSGGTNQVLIENTKSVRIIDKYQLKSDRVMNSLARARK